MFLKTKATDGVNTVIKAASRVASRYNNNQIASEHILYGLAFNTKSVASGILAHFDITSTGILEVLEKSKVQSVSSDASVELTPKAERLFSIASQISLDLGAEFMGTEHLLLALLTDKNSVAACMIEQIFSVKIDSIRAYVNMVLGKEDPKLDVALQKDETPDLANSNLPEELLAMGEDLTLRAYNKKIDPIIGRDAEIERVIEVLCRKGKNNPIIIGKPGVGKSAIVYGLAQRIIDGDVPQDLQNKIIYSLDVGSLMAGTKYRGALEEKLKKVIEIVSNSKEIILFVDEIHTIMQAGEGKGEVSPADMLKPYLSRGDLQTIGATTIAEYQKFIEKDKALERRFQPVVVEPPSKEDTIAILKGLKAGFETYHNVTITEAAIVAAVELSERYITDRNLPDKAIDLIDESSSKAKLKQQGKNAIIAHLQGQIEELIIKKQQALQLQDFALASTLSEQILQKEKELKEEKLAPSTVQKNVRVVVDEDQVATVIGIWTGIPLSKITENEKDKLLHLEEELHRRIVGQAEAVSAVSAAIRRARVGLKDASRPIGSFIFVGQTGVGKTELCKALAQVMFGMEQAMIRFDMSEFMEAHSVAKLIGAPAGYVGYEDGGLLTDAIRKKPYSVILFDEMEKAHKDVFNLLLQVLEDARLTDSKGNVVNFKNTIIIFTSNVGTDALSLAKAKNSALEKEQAKEIVLKELKRFVRDEFVNRIDQIILFDSLKREELAQITKLMIIKLNKKLLSKKLELKLTESAFKHLITKGTNEKFGARPLRRVIEQEVEDKITQDLLTGALQENSTIIIDVKGEKLQFLYQTKK